MRTRRSGDSAITPWPSTAATSGRAYMPQRPVQPSLLQSLSFPRPREPGFRQLLAGQLEAATRLRTFAHRCAFAVLCVPSAAAVDRNVLDTMLLLFCKGRCNVRAVLARHGDPSQRALACARHARARTCSSCAYALLWHRRLARARLICFGATLRHARSLRPPVACQPWQTFPYVHDPPELAGVAYCKSYAAARR